MFAGFSATRALPTATQFLGPSPAVSTAPPPTPTSSLLQPIAGPRRIPSAALPRHPLVAVENCRAGPEDGPPPVGGAMERCCFGGFVGPHATLPPGPAASANSYDWSAPHSVYGWPAPIGLILSSGVTGPVTLSGWDVRTGHPLWFGSAVAGVWGAPHTSRPSSDWTQLTPLFKWAAGRAPWSSSGAGRARLHTRGRSATPSLPPGQAEAGGIARQRWSGQHWALS